VKHELLRYSVGLNALLIAAVACLIVRPKLNETESNAAASRTVASSNTSSASKDPLRKASSFNWTFGDRSSVIAQLRRLGAPPQVLYAVAATLLDEHYSRRRLAIINSIGKPRWQQAQAQQISAQQRSELSELMKQRDADLKRLLGDDYAQRMTRSNSYTSRLGLDEASTTKVNGILADYAELRRQALSEPPKTQTAINDRLEKELLSDLRSTLIPKEYADYITYNSSLAVSLQRRLSGVTMDDAQYEAVFNAVSTFRDNFRTNPANAKTGDGGVEYRLSEISSISSAVGDDVALVVAKNQDDGFKEVASLYTPLRETASQTLDRYKAYLRFYTELSVLQLTTRSQVETYKKGADAASQAYSALTTGLSESAKREFDATSAGTFLRRFIDSK